MGLQRTDISALFATLLSTEASVSLTWSWLWRSGYTRVLGSIEFGNGAANGFRIAQFNSHIPIHH